MRSIVIFALIFGLCFSQSKKNKRTKSKSKLTSIKKSASKKVKVKRNKQKNRTRTSTSSSSNSNRDNNRRQNRRNQRRHNANYDHYSIYPVPFVTGHIYPDYTYSPQVVYIDRNNEKDEEKDNSFGPYYDEYPFHTKTLIKNAGKPYVFKAAFLHMPENEDKILTKEFVMQIDYRSFHLSYEYSYMFDNFEKFVFQTIAPGLTIGLPNQNMMLTFKLGAGLLTIEEDRTYGGLVGGFSAFAIIDPNFSARFAIDYNTYKDRTEDNRALFNTLKTDFSVGIHFSRLELRGGFRVKQFFLLDEPYSIRQPYLGLGLWF